MHIKLTTFLSKVWISSDEKVKSSELFLLLEQILYKTIKS